MERLISPPQVFLHVYILNISFDQPRYGDPSKNSAEGLLARKILLLLREHPAHPSHETDINVLLESMLRDTELASLLHKEALNIDYQQGVGLRLPIYTTDAHTIIKPVPELEQYKPALFYPSEGKPFCGFHEFEVRATTEGVLTSRSTAYPVDTKILAAVLASASHSVGKILPERGPYQLNGPRSPNYELTGQFAALTAQQVKAGFNEALQRGSQVGFFSYDNKSPPIPISR